MSWESINRCTQSRASEAKGREFGTSEHIMSKKSTSGWERWSRCPQLPDVSTKWTIRSPRQHFRCRFSPILAGTDLSNWKASHSLRRWFRMWFKRKSKFEIIYVIISNWEQAPKRSHLVVFSRILAIGTYSRPVNKDVVGIKVLINVNDDALTETGESHTRCATTEIDSLLNPLNNRGNTAKIMSSCTNSHKTGTAWLDPCNALSSVATRDKDTRCLSPRSSPIAIRRIKTSRLSVVRAEQWIVLLGRCQTWYY